MPNANIVFGGTGANRTVTVTPAANQTGTTTITLTVSDGTATATDTFGVTVTAVNDPPTISDVANQATAEDTATGALAFTVGDVETAAAASDRDGDLVQHDPRAEREHRPRRQPARIAPSRSRRPPIRPARPPSR